MNLPEKTFKPNYWKTLNLSIRNKGNAHARSVKISFSKEVEVKGLKELDVNSGEEKRSNIVFKPNELGEVPLEIETSYKDTDGKEYAAEKMFMIIVGEKVREKPKPIHTNPVSHLTIERTIYDPTKGFIISRAVELPNVKKWIESHDSSMYWFVLCIKNNSDELLDKWNIEIDVDSILKFLEVRIEGSDVDFNLEKVSFNPSTGKQQYGMSPLPERLGLVIPRRGARRVFMKLDSKACNQYYEIGGRVISGDFEDRIQVKGLNLGCARGYSLKDAIKKHPDTADDFGKATFGKIRLETLRSWIEVQKCFKFDGIEKKKIIGKLRVLEENMTREGNSELKGGINEMWRRVEQESISYVPEDYLNKMDIKLDEVLRVWCANVY
ncbi:MAG: hypothetical protein AEth_01165 [Candidatus Argoarchaeum ethanivorans]|uniref:CARDB domain-containing protein n=1 Tax=Candidatus Argoarchaeum ethanivorans TaxID=2608793 RepID=A0A8B3S186_9EURY|nr:MAG: hypothetical protein AEth_01165 [Candidatus Argoarchaeum ethanivorans]